MGEVGDRRLGQAWTPAQRWKNEVLFRAALAGLWGARRLSDGSRRAAGRRLGRLGAWLWRGGLERAQRRLSAVFGSRPPVTAWEVFETLGGDLADTLALLHPSVRASERMPLASEVKPVLDEMLARGRGVIFVTAHLGPIDVMAASVAEQGYRVATLARESYDPRFTALYDALRAPRGVRTIYRGRAGAETAVIRALRSGMLVGFPMDLAGRGMRTCEVDFLGETTPIAAGPATLARRLGVPVVVGSPAPTDDGLQVSVQPLELPGCDEAQAVGVMAMALERRIRALPAHWPWMHSAVRGIEERAIARS